MIYLIFDVKNKNVYKFRRYDSYMLMLHSFYSENPDGSNFFSIQEIRETEAQNAINALCQGSEAPYKGFKITEYIL